MVTRANLLRGRVGGKQALRPPWAIEEQQFVDLCSRCDKCIEACPESIIKRGGAGFPEIDFQLGECTFCAECLAVCKDKALIKKSEDALAWNIKADIDKESCLVTAKKVMCQICGEQCELRAIRFQPALGGLFLPSLDQDICNGCGACIAPCPVKAINTIEDS